MLKALRKYNKWILVIGGTLLMMAFLVQPALQQLGGDPRTQVIARLDGKPIRLGDAELAGKELVALDALTNGIFSAVLGIDGRDTRHWTLLKAEAREGGFIGEAEDGPAWLPELAQAMVPSRMHQLYGQTFGDQIWRDPQYAPFFQQFHGKSPQAALQEALEQETQSLEVGRQRVGRNVQMTQQQVDHTLAAARGVFRMLDSYSGAARMSDRLAIAKSRRLLDGAYVDLLPITAARFAQDIPAPDDAALQSHVDRFKTVRPGQGDYGIGYLLPPRVKLEWLTLDAAAIEAAMPLDPVEVSKRYLQNRDKYPGELAAERERVERDLRAAKLTQIMQEAHRAIQAEVMRTTRRLEADGRFKRLPEDWAAARPKMEAIARAVVEQVTKATGVTIPLPTVTVEAARWLTPDDLAAEPGLGSARLQLGNVPIQAAEVIFSVRELARSGAEEFPIPVQVGIPLAENYLSDLTGNRHYVTVLDARLESAPDTLEEVRERATNEYKELQAFERLTQRLPELRSLALSGGLDAVRDAVFAPPSIDPELVGPPKPDERPAVQQRVLVSREVLRPGPMSVADPAAIQSVDAPSVRDAIMDAAGTLDPLTPPELLDAQKATVAAAAPPRRSIAVARLTALQPMTAEAFRAIWPQLSMRVQNEEMAPEGVADAPFSLKRLLARHEYIEEGSSKRLTGDEEPESPGA